MPKFQISSDWTDQDRKEVIKAIAAEMVKKAKNITFIASGDVYDWAMIITYVTIMTSEFLEANRAKILEVAGW